MNNAHTPAIGLLMLLASLMSPSVSADIIYVDDNAPPGGDGLTWTAAYDNLQDALRDASTNGAVTEIRVAAGTYAPSQRTQPEVPRTETFSLINGLTISGGYAGLAYPENPEVRDLALYKSTLSGDLAGDDVGEPWDQSWNENSYHVVTGSGTDDTTALDGFMITGGNTEGDEHYYGGGMYNSNGSPQVISCTFSRNSAGSGGGMYNVNGSNPQLVNCAFVDNEARGSNGGGMYNSDSNPSLDGCLFASNGADDNGGGIYNVNSSPTLTNCTFYENGGWGGAMDNQDGSSPTIIGCNFIHNYGSAMRNSDSSPTLVNCALSGNWGRDGGGMCNYSSSPTLANCNFSGNSAQVYGGGMYNDESSPTLFNCTFSGNSASYGRGGGIHNDYDSGSTLTNCILWENGEGIYDEGGSTTFVTYSNVQGGWPGTGNIDADPVFVRDPDDGGDGWSDDPETPDVDEGANDDYGDLRLQADSPCIDTGDPAFVPGPGTTDLDGHARVLCGRVDMGAYEFGIGDYDCDRSVDLLDYLSWPGCFTGPLAGPYADSCEAFDFDFDGDVDLHDFAGFQGVFEEP